MKRLDSKNSRLYLMILFTIPCDRKQWISFLNVYVIIKWNLSSTKNSTDYVTYSSLFLVQYSNKKTTLKIYISLWPIWQATKPVFFNPNKNPWAKNRLTSNPPSLVLPIVCNKNLRKSPIPSDFLIEIMIIQLVLKSLELFVKS